MTDHLSTEELFDGLTLAVLGLDSQLRVRIMNSAAEILFGVSAGYAVGEPVTSAIPHLASQVDHLRSALENAQPYTERELKLQRNGGDPMTVDCTVTPLRTAAESCLLLEFLQLDRHLRITRDDQLWHQQEISREMIRGLAHEVKNPLGGLRGAAQLLARQLPDPDLREYTDVIIGEADRLQNLVDRLLGPNTLPVREPVNVHEVLEHVFRLCRTQAPAQLELERDYDPSLPDVLADREQLIQAVLNVVINAIEALGDSGRVCLRSRAHRQFTIGGQRHRLVLRIDIEDNGRGVPADMREHIFYPMVTTRAEGSGLGLAIAQNLIHNHGGLIECDSQPGCTIFSIYLPPAAGETA